MKSFFISLVTLSMISNLAFASQNFNNPNIELIENVMVLSGKKISKNQKRQGIEKLLLDYSQKVDLSSPSTFKDLLETAVNIGAIRKSTADKINSHYNNNLQIINNSKNISNLEIESLIHHSYLAILSDLRAQGSQFLSTCGYAIAGGGALLALAIITGNNSTGGAIALGAVGGVVLAIGLFFYIFSLGTC